MLRMLGQGWICSAEWFRVSGWPGRAWRPGTTSVVGRSPRRAARRFGTGRRCACRHQLHAMSEELPSQDLELEGFIVELDRTLEETK